MEFHLLLSLQASFGGQSVRPPSASREMVTINGPMGHGSVQVSAFTAKLLEKQKVIPYSQLLQQVHVMCSALNYLTRVVYVLLATSS